MKDIREIFISKMVNITGVIYTKIMKRNHAVWSLKKEDIKGFPSSSLGKHLYQFLEMHQLDLMPKHESHDLFHLLTNYGITTIDEMKMQFFLLGNGKKSIYLMISIMMSYLFFPEYNKAFKTAYKKGKAANRFYDWEFEKLLSQPFEIIHTKIFAIHENVSPSQLLICTNK